MYQAYRLCQQAADKIFWLAANPSGDGNRDHQENIQIQDTSAQGLIFASTFFKEGLAISVS